MHVATEIFNAERVKTKTSFTRRRVLNAIKIGQAMELDERRDRRLSEMECRFCFYAGPRIAGQAFTDRNCASCKILMQFSSTDTDIVCGDCAQKHEVCRHCGADRELREYRQDFSTFDPVSPPVIEQPQAATVFLLPARKRTKSKGDVTLT